MRWSGSPPARRKACNRFVIYMATYIAMTAGTFGVILMMHRNGQMVEKLSDLAGLSRARPGLALAMMLFMFSFAGVPPLIGFFGMFYVFIAAIHAHYYYLAVIGVLTSVVSAYYYLKIIKIMYFDEPSTSLDKSRSWTLSAVVLCVGDRDDVLFREALAADRSGAGRNDIAAFGCIRSVTAPFTFERHDELDSTNLEAMRRAREGARDLAIIADRQSGRQGRHGREWNSPTGNLFLSLLIQPDISPCAWANSRL